jgi:hypothetical protein
VPQRRRREEDSGSKPRICNRFQEEQKSVVKIEICLIDMIVVFLIKEVDQKNFK